MGLIATIAEATRAEAAAAALRCAAIGVLAARRVDADDRRALWACDGWDSAAAEVAAAMNISHAKACGQIRIAESLRDRLPKLAALFGQGRVAPRVIGVITWRTRLITDEQVWQRIDTALAQRVETWGPLAEEKLTAAVDALVLRLYSPAVISACARVRGRDFTVGSYDDEAGLAAVWGTLLRPDAEVFQHKIAAIAATVCPDDPRSAGERRSDAAGALANGNAHLACGCGSPSCPAANQPAPTSSVVITVVADQAAVAAAQTGATPSPEAGTAILSGTEMLPTPMLAALLRNGATLRPLCVPDDKPEAGYRPSAKLARFVRARDLTCRFPGCTTPAEFCDIDHVIPYPIGPTHPANLACLCRKHHLVETFFGWTEQQLPDGTVTHVRPPCQVAATQ